jgi:hypothetical protein
VCTNLDPDHASLVHPCCQIASHHEDPTSLLSPSLTFCRHLPPPSLTCPCPWRHSCPCLWALGGSPCQLCCLCHSPLLVMRPWCQTCRPFPSQACSAGHQEQHRDNRVEWAGSCTDLRKDAAAVGCSSMGWGSMVLALKILASGLPRRCNPAGTPPLIPQGCVQAVWGEGRDRQGCCRWSGLVSNTGSGTLPQALDATSS